MSERLSGVFTALITPFEPSGAFDEGAHRRLVKRQVEAGVAGVVPCGTTGEAATLTADEHEAVVRATVEAARGSRCRVIAGCGTNDTKRTAVPDPVPESWLWVTTDGHRHLPVPPECVEYCGCGEEYDVRAFARCPECQR